MSKPELPGGQSLEEILASIRKTLAEDRPEEDAAAPLELPRVEEAPRVENGAGPADGDTLHQRLVLGLGGSNGATEDSLSDLLASDLGAPILTPKASNGSLDRHDPPWFATRAADGPAETNGAADHSALNGDGLNGNGALKAALNGANGSATAKPKADDISLTRPETLRRTFPPLFGDGGEVAPRPFDSPAERPAKNLEGLATVRREDIPNLRMPKSAELPGGNSAANAQPDPTKAFNHLEARFRAISEPAPAAEPVVAPEPVKVAEPAPTPVAAVAVRPEPVEPTPADAPVAEAAKPAKASVSVAGLADQPLQEVIARLLEPVIQEWLDANLPRMVEAAIREEVTRQLKVSRGELKI